MTLISLPMFFLHNLPLSFHAFALLQKALMTEIPNLSKILMENGITKLPITAVVRKGREHYVCERNLRAHLQFERDSRTRQTLEALLDPRAEIDLAEIVGLTAYAQRKIAVPSRCGKDCPHRKACAICYYRAFRSQILSISRFVNFSTCTSRHTFTFATGAVFKRSSGCVHGVRGSVQTVRPVGWRWSYSTVTSICGPEQSLGAKARATHSGSFIAV